MKKFLHLKNFLLVAILAVLYFFFPQSFHQGNTPEKSHNTPESISATTTISPKTDKFGSANSPQASKTDDTPKDERIHFDKYYRFRSYKKLTDHFQKHRQEFDYADEKEYLYHANLIIHDPNSVKSQQNDGDWQYLNKDTCEYVVVSSRDYIRTYFRPNNCAYYFEKQR